MLDARAAKALAAGDHITVEGAPGLRLVATASKRTWTYRYRSPVDGRMRQVRLGHWPAMGLPAALAAWERVAAQRNAGGDPAAEARTRRRAAVVERQVDAFTVRRACDEYLSSYERLVAPKTYAEAARLLSLELGDLASRPAASITRADAFGLIDGMRDRPVLAIRVRQLLGAIWDRALDAGQLAADVPNWWRLILRGQIKSRGAVVRGVHRGVAKRVLSEAELRVLLPWLPNFTADIEDALTLYLWTCCRGGEIVSMDRDEISEEADGLWWTIPRARLKMRRNPATVDLRVPLTGRAEAIVRRRLGATESRYLWPSVGRDPHVDQGVLSSAVWMRMPACTLRPDYVRARLPVADWTPHDLRRTGRTLLASLGCPAEIAEAILGHLPPGIQSVYNLHSYDAERRAWLTRLAQHLETLAAPARAEVR